MKPAPDPDTRPGNRPRSRGSAPVRRRRWPWSASAGHARACYERTRSSCPSWRHRDRDRVRRFATRPGRDSLKWPRWGGLLQRDPPRAADRNRRWSSVPGTTPAAISVRHQGRETHPGSQAREYRKRWALVQGTRRRGPPGDRRVRSRGDLPVSPPAHAPTVVSDGHAIHTMPTIRATLTARMTPPPVPGSWPGDIDRQLASAAARSQRVMARRCMGASCRCPRVRRCGSDRRRSAVRSPPRAVRTSRGSS
jgi:hypothetical protein